MKKNYSLGFIGIGNMGSALARAASERTDSLLLSCRTPEKAKKLADTLGCDAGDNICVARLSDYVILGVKPQVIGGVISEIADTLKGRVGNLPCVVSMAAGVTIGSIAEALGFDCPIIRIMPNTPVSIGMGVVLYTCNDAAKGAITDRFLELMSASGEFVPLDESLFDAGSALSGCSPAFADIFTDALADGGVRCGLSREVSLKLAAATVAGAAKLILTSKKHPDLLRDEVCSPGGSTIEGVSVLERYALRAAVSDAVVASKNKTAELGKKNK